MKKLKLWARISEALVLLAGLAVLFGVLSLEDILKGDTYPEWTVIRLSFVVIVLCLISTFITLYYLFRYIEHQDEEKADIMRTMIKRAAGPDKKEPEPQSPPAALRTRTKKLPGKSPSSSTAKRQTKRTR